MEFNWINYFNIIIVILMLIPNIIYEIKNRKSITNKANIAITVVEELSRYASIAFMILPVFVHEFGFSPLEWMYVYLIGNIIFLLIYFVFWGLYFKKQTKKRAIVLAIAPVMIFVITALSISHWALFVSAVIFGASHLYITIKNN